MRVRARSGASSEPQCRSCLFINIYVKGGDDHATQLNSVERICLRQQFKCMFADTAHYCARVREEVKIHLM